MIPVNEPVVGAEEKRLLNECIDSGWISSEGPFVARFENEMATRLGRKFGIAVCNGSAALESAVAALELGPGDEIILPTLTIISCAAAVVRAGAVPVLVDCDPDTWNMDVNQIEDRITARTKAIMAVHIYGLPVDMDPVIDIAQQHGLRVIEDAAEAIGQTCRGRPCGSFGDVSVLSFYPNKHVTTGEGGMLLTDDKDLAARCRALRNLCFEPAQRFVHRELGWNMRMSNLQAAVGIAQLARLDETIKRKREMGRRYTTCLTDCDQVQLPQAATDYAENIYWVFGVVLNDAVPGEAARIMERLKAKGIGTRPFFWPLHRQPVFMEKGLFAGDQFPAAERLGRRGFYLPSGLALTAEQIDQVAQTLQEVLA
jgi:perosamine synthetase